MTGTAVRTASTDLAAPSAHRVSGRLTASTAITGAVVMVSGAALYFSAGADADLPAALAADTMPAYLETVTGNPAIVANLSLWIVGALLMGASGTGFALLGRARPAEAGLGAAAGLLGASTAVAAFVAWLSVVVIVAPTGDAGLAEVIGWFAWHMDHIATALIVGVGPLLYGLAGRSTWAPRWLVGWGILAGVVGVQSVVVAYLPALAASSVLIVPVGIGWLIAAGIVVLRGVSTSTPSPVAAVSAG